MSYLPSTSSTSHDAAAIMDLEDEYECLPTNSTMTTHMCAGAAAGIMEHCLMYPVDIVRTRMQALTPHPHAQYRNVIDAFYRIVRYEGARTTLRGINVTAYGAGPAHALYFASYEKIKQLLRQSGSSNHLVHGAAGSCATLLHDAVMNPADVIKQRMQVFESRHKTCLDCIRTVYREEGLVAFYRSYTTQLTMNIPFQSLHFMLYEFSQDLFNPERCYNPRSHILSGGLAGAIAAAATTPLDVCKTLLNTQEQCRERCPTEAQSRAVTGLGNAFRTVYQFRGMRGFFAGITARVIYQAPSTAISWSVYEFFKFLLTQRDAAHRTTGSSLSSSSSSVGTDYGSAASSVVAATVQLHAASAGK